MIKRTSVFLLSLLLAVVFGTLGNPAPAGERQRYLNLRNKVLVALHAAGGNGIEVSETATFETPEGAANIQATRKWTLSPDGKTLKIEMTVDGPNGKQVLKRTFVKK